jgi:hypothetical protein
MTQQDDLSLRHIAVHEAGHWIAAYEMGHDSEEITIVATDWYMGRVAAEMEDSYFEPGPEARHNCAVILYAAHAAVVEVLGIGDMGEDSADRLGGSNDFAYAREMLGGDGPAIAAAQASAVEIVKTRRGEILALVEKLLALGRLDGQQAEAAASGAWDLWYHEDGTRRPR